MIKAILNRIVIRPDNETEKVSKGGILLPERSQNKPDRGTVIAVGKGKINSDGSRSEMDVKVGDYVYYARNFAMPLSVKGEDYVVIKDEDLLVSINGK